ncbi:MAG TPA: hypothetical protein VFK05_11075 [Polyangiaceae bacterium]|nr:hypothetical protein [Polyangiaceae bacterium]
MASLPVYSVFSAALTLLGCAGASQPGAQPAKSETKESAAPSAGSFDFDATYKREASGLSERALQGSKAGWSAKVPASADPKLAQAENSELVEIPIGSKAPVRCQVFSEQLDAGGTLHGVLKESAARVEYRSIAPSGVRLLGGVPTTFLETVYLTETEGGKGAGGLKLAIQVREQESLLCLHDELGYRQTFKDVSGAFFSSFKPRSAPPNAATYSDITKAKIGDTDVGFGWVRVTPGEKPGERSYSDSNTTLIPTSAKEVSFRDNYEVFSYDAKNVLQAATWVEGSGGEITMKIGIHRQADGSYAMQGELGGKPVSGELKAPNGIATSLDIATRLKKKLKTGAPFELKLPEYHPSLEPKALIDVVYRHQKGDPARQVSVTMANGTMIEDVDDNGMAKSFSFPVGKSQFVVERLKSEGHL